MGGKKPEKKPEKAKKKTGPRIYKPGKFCPKCGAGVKLAAHKDRLSCGKCGYFEKK
jgi:small subunit ribosomal protein S27Ae